MTHLIQLIIGLSIGYAFHRLLQLCNIYQTSSRKFDAATRKWDYINMQLAELKWRPIIITNDADELQAAIDELTTRQRAIGKLQAMDPQEFGAPWNETEKQS